MTQTKRERENIIKKVFKSRELIGIHCQTRGGHESGVRVELMLGPSGGEVGLVWGDQELILEVKEGDEARGIWRVQEQQGSVCGDEVGGPRTEPSPTCPPNKAGRHRHSSDGNYLLPSSSLPQIRGPRLERGCLLSTVPVLPMQ